MPETNYPAEYFFDPVITGANLTVYLGGLAVVHNHSAAWQSVFLEGITDHDLKAELQVFENGSMVSAYQLTLPSVGQRPINIECKPAGTWNNDFWQGGGAGDHRVPESLGEFSGGELHDGPVAFDNSHQTPLTPLTLSDGICYTARLADGLDNAADLYCFAKLGNPVRYLGNWTAFDCECEIDTSLTFEIDGESVENEIGEQLIMSSGRSYRVIIDNMCNGAQCSTDIDFPFYYTAQHNGRQGIVAEDPIGLVLVKEMALPNAMSNRVACNVMIVKELSGITSLFDLA
jgi:hypothetical protein